MSNAFYLAIVDDSVMSNEFDFGTLVIALVGNFYQSLFLIASSFCIVVAIIGLIDLSVRLFCSLVLSCRADHPSPQGAVQVDHSSFFCGEFDRHMCKEIVPVSDDQVGFAAHAGMNSIFCEKMAQYGI